MTKLRDERLELIEALSALQKSHKEIVDKYTIQTKARLRELLDDLQGNSTVDSRPRKISRSKAKEMLEEIKDVRVKPEKGRGKDLYRIEKLLSELEETYQGQ